MTTCPKCDFRTTVVDSRPSAGTIRRRRECDRCQHRWTTYEVSDDVYAQTLRFARMRTPEGKKNIDEMLKLSAAFSARLTRLMDILDGR